MQTILRILLFSEEEKPWRTQSYQGLKAGQDQKEKVNAWIVNESVEKV